VEPLPGSEIVLPSGAKLQVVAARFELSKGLWESVLKVIRGVPIAGTGGLELVDLYKNLFSDGFTSPEVQKWLWPCAISCLYNDGKAPVKVEPQVFEQPEARQDYLKVCMEVVKVNIDPFVKGLYAEYGSLLAELTKGFPASRSETKSSSPT